MGSFTVALGHAGPTIIGRGTPEQKAAYLPRILRGETPWCQGFSEPGAGSDLASLRTRAVIDGDDLVISGSKIWTSFAHVSDFQELLVRTDPDAPRHKGLSWVIVPMDIDGLTIRRIRTIDGASGFCECFYDDVRVPLTNVVGALNDGWSVAMHTLSIERGMGFLASRLTVAGDVDRLMAEAEARDLLTDSRIASELAAVRAQARAVHALGYDGVSASANTEIVAAVNRVFYGELLQRVGRLAVDILGPDALESNPWSMAYLESLSRTIASGTKEIQKNILAERVLGLPR
jgi:alkylation response protein AidB-like acyl-CoA dehydrogenase